MSGITVKNFAPYETVPLTLVASVSGSVAFKLPGSWLCPDVMVTNSGATIAFVNFGVSALGAVTAQTPATTGTLGATPVLPGETLVFSKDEFVTGADTCAGYSTGTPTLYFTSGVGT